MDTTIRNVIYFDENMKFEENPIPNDCNKMEKETKCTLILVNDLNNFNLLLKFISKNNPNAKFALVVNGSSAEKVIGYIKEQKYESFFIKASLYTENREKYVSIRDDNPDFVELIANELYKVNNFIVDTFEEYGRTVPQFKTKTLINFYNYKDKYSPLHIQLSLNYGDISEKTFLKFFPNITQLLEKENYSKEIKDEIVNSFKSFSLLKKKEYEKVIITYLKNENYSKYLNELLMKKDLQTNMQIGYFAGNLMYSIVEYGKKKKMDVKENKTFYRGLQLNIVDVLELLKNKGFIITFPYFVSITANKNYAEIISKRYNEKYNNNQDRDLFSVIMKIDNLYNKHEPCVYDLQKIIQYPDEEECIMLPFTFLNLKKINIDSNKLTADIDFEIVEKKEIFENKLKKNKKAIVYDLKQNLMIIK